MSALSALTTVGLLTQMVSCEMSLQQKLRMNGPETPS